MMNSVKSKSKKKYFNKKYNYAQNKSLEPNLKGFLCSCNNREKECIREAYNVLNHYADKLNENSEATQNVPEKPSDDTDDIEDELLQEISSLKPTIKRFQYINSGAKNIIFIRTTIDNPVELAETIVTAINQTKNRETRYLIRLIPIEITCKANINDIEKAFEPILEKYFTNGSKKFSIIFNHRNNNSLSKDGIIKMVADKIMSLNSDHKVNLTEAEISVIVEIIKGIALLAVVPNFLKYKKYNLHSLSNDDASECNPSNNDTSECNPSNNDTSECNPSNNE